MEAVGKSVTGNVRSNNEDCIYVGDKTEQIYIVADGMGGHNGGEIASSLAIKSFINYLDKNKKMFDKDDCSDIIVGAITYANKIVYEKSLETEETKGMGTTFTCVIMRNGNAYVAHVGDSRAYILKSGKLCQLTKDHSYVMEMVKRGKITIQEAENHPRRNVITRAVGTTENIEVDLISEKADEGDIILICSDGLTTMVKDSDIEGVLNNKLDLNSKAERLIEMANENGGKDNISVIIIRYEVET